MASKIALFFKGMAMGTVDIVPGVSGSTVAVLLGIYERFIGALKNINLALIKGLLSPFANKFSPESRQKAIDAAKNADLPWLLILLAGLATAFVIASIAIPALMERFPEIMRGVFFGLVLGSIITPVRDIGKSFKPKHIVMIAACAVLCFFVLGMQVSPPTQAITVVTQGGETFEQLCRNAPCLNAPADVLALEINAAAQTATATAPMPAAAPLPAGISVTLQTPYFLFCIAAGFLAICAMLLPGISGSFILLILGAYYFMLNTGKGFLAGLAQGTFLGSHLLYICCFAFGALAGIAVFSRVFTWLLKKYHHMTLAAIIGILLGCLRAVWPYRISGADGTSMNIWPGFDTPLLWQTSVAILAGLAIVVITVIIQVKLDKNTAAKAAAETV